MSASGEDNAIAELVASVSDLHCGGVDELDEEPSPLEFMRYVARNAPFVVRGAARGWKATQRWNVDYLTKALEGQTVRVAITPNGRADAPTFMKEEGISVLAKPHEEFQSFSDFIARFDQGHDNVADAREVQYAQTQNDNLRNEYAILYSDVQKDIAFARIALERPPDAINLWIGNQDSVTALHKDPMENIYVQIKGRKHFTLLPPLHQPCVNEQMIRPATYRRQGDKIVLEMDEDASEVPLAMWDPAEPELNACPWSHLAQPLKVTLNPGDMLYLPAMWYHKVEQSTTPESEGIVVAANYWYDMDYSGPLYSFTQYLHNINQGRQK